MKPSPPIPFRTSVCSPGPAETETWLRDLTIRVPPGHVHAAYSSLVELIDHGLRPGAVRAQATREAAAAQAAAAAAAIEAALTLQVYHGTRSRVRPACWSHIGFRCDDGRSVAVAREGGQVLVACGTIGSGKSQGLLSLIESCIGPLPPLSSATLPPTAVVAIHADLSGVALPELCYAVAPNDRAGDLEFLRSRLGTSAEGLPKLRLVCHRDELPRRRAQLEEALGENAALVDLRPFRLRLSQVGMQGLAALCGAPPTRVPGYLQTLLGRARELGGDLTLAGLRRGLSKARELTQRTRDLALARLDFLSVVEDSEAALWDDVGLRC